jgi:hypothetical protein
MSATEEAEVPVIDPPRSLPGHCPTHPDRVLRKVQGRPGPPTCDACDAIKTWERRKALHMREPHQQYVACLTCIEIAIEERKRQGLVPTDLTQPAVVHPLELLRGSPFAPELKATEPWNVPANKPAEPAAEQPLPPQPPKTQSAPATIVIKSPADLDNLPAQPQPLVKETSIVQSPDLTRPKGKGGAK